MSLKPRKSWGFINSQKLNIRLTGIVLLFVIIPVAILGGIVFYNMEQSTIRENVSFTQATMERRRDSITNNVDSINMSTQFFLSNEKLNSVLIDARVGNKHSTKEWLDIYKSDVAALERLINTNPVLGGVRYYAVTDNVQEMMPVLYNHDRLLRQEWAVMAESGGWIFNYTDKLFDNSDTTPMLALITPVVNRQYGSIGTIEANMAMKTMFPSMYENVPGETSCFVTDTENIIFGSNEDTSVTPIATAISQQMKDIVQEGEAPGITTFYDKEKKSVISGMYISELGGTLVSVNDISESLSQVYQLRNNYIIGMILILLMMAFIINILVNHVLKKFYEVLSTIRAVRGGNLDIRGALMYSLEECGFSL